MNEQDIREARETYLEAQRYLEHVIEEMCPAEDGHNPVQHRDRNPPWCAKCGRTKNGTKTKEMNETE